MTHQNFTCHQQFPVRLIQRTQFNLVDFILFLFSEATSVLLLMASLGILGFGLGGNGTIFMKVVLSGLPQQEAGAGTGTYGLFRDLAAPFGVAVFVPLFTNQITGLIAGGVSEVNAAIHSIHQLAIVELLCIATGTRILREAG